MYKLTGVGIKTLRYYDEINLFNPVCKDPYSEYRYYSIDQVQLLEMIVFCTELNIPLKEIAKWIDADGGLNLNIFIAQAKEIAEQKMIAVNKGLTLISEIERKLKLANKYQSGQIYYRDIPEKTFYLKKFEQSVKSLEPSDIGRVFMEMPFDKHRDVSAIEYGVLCDHSPSGNMYYFFIEVPNRMADSNIRKIPAGKYICIRGDETQIEQTSEIFTEHLEGSGSFLAIEIEDISTGKSSKNTQMCELRVLRL
jgi:DNA-binding transcriptional MerR regulator